MTELNEQKTIVEKNLIFHHYYFLNVSPHASWILYSEAYFWEISNFELQIFNLKWLVGLCIIKTSTSSKKKIKYVLNKH